MNRSWGFYVSIGGNFLKYKVWNSLIKIETPDAFGMGWYDCGPALCVLSWMRVRFTYQTTKGKEMKHILLFPDDGMV